MSIQTSSSSTTHSNTSPTSSTNVPSQEAYYRQYVPPKPQTPAQIRAAGDVKFRLGILWFVGVICTALILFGATSYILDPKNSKDVWIIIGPIISGAITGTVSYFTGEKQGEKK